MRLHDAILRALDRAPKKSLNAWQLVSRVGYLPEVVRTVEALNKTGWVSIEGETILLTAPASVMKPLRAVPPKIASVMAKYCAARQRVSFSRDDFDQLGILPNGIERKLRLAIERDDLRDKDVLCIGDDDLFSVACALTGLPRSVHVLEIDPTVIAAIRSAKTRVPIKIHRENLLNALSRPFHGKFDTVFTEPPDKLKGTMLFLSRGMAALKKDGVAYVGMPRQTLPLKHWQAIQRMAVNAGFVMTDALRDAEPYETLGVERTWNGFANIPEWMGRGAKSPWFISTLFRLERATTGSIPKIKITDVSREMLTNFVGERGL